MEQGIVVKTEDIKKILAEYFGVDEKQVISAKYSWIIVGATKNSQPT